MHESQQQMAGQSIQQECWQVMHQHQQQQQQQQQLTAWQCREYVSILAQA